MTPLDERLTTLVYAPSPAGMAIARIKQRGGWTPPDCDAPVSVELFEGQLHVHPVYDGAGSLVITVPCRKCAKCRARRARLWYARMRAESATARKTWFVTLTFAKDETAPYRAVQLFLKRLRKIERVRFCAVQEAGERGGRLHWHMMLHCQTLTKRQVQTSWSRNGFSGCKLATEETCGYMSGYTTSDMLRVHASKSYGNDEAVEKRGRRDGETLRTGFPENGNDEIQAEISDGELQQQVRDDADGPSGWRRNARQHKRGPSTGGDWFFTDQCWRSYAPIWSAERAQQLHPPPIGPPGLSRG